MPTIRRTTVRTTGRRRTGRQPRVARTTTTTVASKARRVQKSMRRSMARIPRGIPGRSTAGHAFVECALAPVGAPSMSTGYPDGGPNPTVVVDFRQVFVVQPVRQTQDPSLHGQVQFAIHPSPLGALAIDKGNAVVRIADVHDDTGLVNGVVSYNSYFNGGVAIDRFGLIPFTQNLKTAIINSDITGTVQNDTGFAIQGWRVLSNKANIVYTGNDFNNQGTWSAARQQIRVERIASKPTADGYHYATGQYRQALNSSGPLDFTSNAQIPGSIQGAVGDLRCGVDILNLPYDYEWQSWQDNSTPLAFDGAGAGYAAFYQYAKQAGTADTTMPVPTPGVGHAPTTYFSVVGMEEDQSLTVSVQTCVEFTLDYDSPMQQMAKMPPPVDVGAQDAVKSIARGLPAAKSSDKSWFVNALDWYGGAMKDSYQAITGTASELLFGKNIWGKKDNLGLDASTVRSVLNGVARSRNRPMIR